MFVVFNLALVKNADEQRPHRLVINMLRIQEIKTCHVLKKEMKVDHETK